MNALEEQTLPSVDRGSGFWGDLGLRHELAGSLPKTTFEAIVIDVNVEPGGKGGMSMVAKGEKKVTPTTDIFSPSHERGGGFASCCCCCCWIDGCAEPGGGTVAMGGGGEAQDCWPLVEWGYLAANGWRSRGTAHSD